MYAAEIFHGKIIDLSSNTITLELQGKEVRCCAIIMHANTSVSAGMQTNHSPSCIAPIMHAASWISPCLRFRLWFNRCVLFVCRER